MNKDIFISIKGIQISLPDNSAVEVISKGKYYKKAGKTYISYEELDEKEEVIKCMIIYDGSRIEIRRSTEGMNTCLVYERDKYCTSSYNTMFGNMLIGFNTRRMDIIETEKCICIDIDYSMDINYSYVSDCNVSIKVVSDYAELQNRNEKPLSF